eukprot:2365164-Prymnesium_polylepis.1
MRKNIHAVDRADESCAADQSIPPGPSPVLKTSWRWQMWSSRSPPCPHTALQDTAVEADLEGVGLVVGAKAVAEMVVARA